SFFRLQFANYIAGVRLMNVGGPIVGGRGQALAVRRERYAARRLLVRSDHAGLSARRQVKQPDGVVVPADGGDAAVWRHGHIADGLTTQDWHLLELLAGGQVPDMEITVHGPADQGLAVRRHGGVHQTFFWTDQRFQLRAVLRVPAADGPVPAGAEQRL